MGKTSSVHSFNHVQLFAIPWTVACQAFLSITNSWSLLKLMSIGVIPSNHLILCHPLLLQPSIFPSIRVFSNEAPLSFTIPWSLLEFISIKSVMLSNISFSSAPFSFCLQSFPASGSFPMSQFFTLCGQSTGATASVLPMNIRVDFL